MSWTNHLTGISYHHHATKGIEVIIDTLDTRNIHWLEKEGKLKIGVDIKQTHEAIKFFCIMYAIVAPVLPKAYSDGASFGGGTFRGMLARLEEESDKESRGSVSKHFWTTRFTFLYLFKRYISFENVILPQDHIGESAWERRSIYESRCTVLKKTKMLKPLWSNNYLLSREKERVLNRKDHYQSRLGGFSLHHGLLIDRVTPLFIGCAEGTQEEWKATSTERSIGFTGNYGKRCYDVEE